MWAIVFGLAGKIAFPLNIGGDMAFNQETADRICERLAAGESLRKACVDGPDPSTILRWTEDNDAFAQQYAQARARGYALLADELIQIADDGTNDSYVDDDGNVRTNQDVIARSRLRVDTRKWMLAKMLPKVYGEKVETTHKGTVGVVLNATPTDEAL